MKDKSMPRFQFSLRTLLIAVLLISTAMYFGITVHLKQRLKKDRDERLASLMEKMRIASVEPPKFKEDWRHYNSRLDFGRTDDSWTLTQTWVEDPCLVLKSAKAGCPRAAYPGVRIRYAKASAYSNAMEVEVDGNEITMRDVQEFFADQKCSFKRAEEAIHIAQK